MRTRRSWRNQNALYKQLFPAPEKPKPQAPEPYTVDSPHLFGMSAKMKAYQIKLRDQEIARWRIKQARHA